MKSNYSNKFKIGPYSLKIVKKPLKKRKIIFFENMKKYDMLRTSWGLICCTKLVGLAINSMTY